MLEQADALVGAVRRELRLAEALSEEAGGGAWRRCSRASPGRNTRRGSPRHRSPGRAGGGRTRCGLRPGVGRLRPGAQVPPAHTGRALPAPRPARRARWGPRPAHGTAHARRHGGGRHLRPPGGRVLPLLHRCSLARAPFRKDAHRPGAAGPGLSARVAGRWAIRVSRRGHRDTGLRAEGSLDPAGRAVLLLRRRRRRGRRRARDLHGRGIAPDPPAAPGGARRRVVRDRAGRQLGGALHSGAPCRGATGASTRGRGGPPPAGSGAGPTGPAGPGREGPDRVERHDRGHPGRGSGGDRPRRLRTPRRGDRRFPLGVHVRRRTADAELAGRAGPPSGRGGRLRLARRGLVPAVRVDGQGTVARPGGPGGPAAARSVLGRRVGRVLHHRQRRRRTRGPSEGVPRRRRSGRQFRRRRGAAPRQCLGGRPEDRRGDRADGASRRTPAGAASGSAGRHGGGAAALERAQRDRRHGRSARPARRSAPELAPCRRHPVGRARRTVRSSRGGRPSPDWPTSARGARARSPPRTPRSWLPSWSHCSHERTLRGSGSETDDADDVGQRRHVGGTSGAGGSGARIARDGTDDAGRRRRGPRT